MELGYGKEEWEAKSDWIILGLQGVWFSEISHLHVWLAFGFRDTHFAVP